jgi:class 3 adenylate cyclase
VIDTQGDSFFVAFRSAADAVSSAVEIQRALVAGRGPEDAEVRVRIGIHTGEASATEERYLGSRSDALGHRRGLANRSGEEDPFHPGTGRD